MKSLSFGILYFPTFVILIFFEMKTLMNEIQGTWILTSMQIIFSGGRTAEMFGNNPNGIAVFDPSGYISVQIGSKNRLPFSSENFNESEPQETKRAFDTYMAFYGHYKESSPGVLVVKIQACLFPNWEQKEIIRYASLTDNKLILTTPPSKTGGEEIVVKAIWERP